MFQNIGTSGAKGMDGSGLMQGLGSASPYIGIASSFINPLLVDQSDPTHENFTPILGSIDYAKQDVNVIDNEFDPSRAYESYQAEDNPYQTGAGNFAQRLGASTLKNVSTLAPLGAVGMIAGGALALGDTIFKGVKNKKNKEEYDDIVLQEENKYNIRQYDYLQEQNRVAQDLAKQQELAMRGVPNYTTNIYNV